jgi:hypothetical protein
MGALVRRDHEGRWFMDRPNGVALELRYDATVTALDQLEAIAQRQAQLVVAQLGGEGWLDKSGLAEHFSCSVRTVESWRAEGMPHKTIAGKVKFRAPEAECWLEQHGLFETVAVMIRASGAVDRRAQRCEDGRH